MGICCSDSARLYDYEPNLVEYEIVRRLRLREQQAVEFRVEGKEQHRHRYYGRMGIYHKQVTDGAQYSGNSSVIMLDAKHRSDLQMLYSDYMDPQEHTLPEIESGSVVGRRSRASSMDSTLSSYTMASEQPAQLYNLRVELNNSMKNYAIPDVEEQASSEQRQQRVSKFRKHLDRVMHQMETDDGSHDLVAIEDYYDEERSSLDDVSSMRARSDGICITDGNLTTEENPVAERELLDAEAHAGPQVNREHVAPRNKYLSKLAYAGVWNTSSKNPRTSKSTSLTIFDWDDTLFPTSAFAPKTPEEMVEIAENYQELFTQIDAVVYSLLMRTLEENSRVIIVTNAHKSWVDYSSQTLMPQTAMLLKERIRVISARIDMSMSMHPVPPNLWKIKKFMELHEMLGLSTDQVTNLVVIGDSMNEMNAGQRLSKKLPCCILKMIKMQEAPQPKELIKQLMVISDAWDTISASARNFNMKLERKQKSDKRSNSSQGGGKNEVCNTTPGVAKN